MRPTFISLVYAFTTDLAVQVNPTVEIARPANLNFADLRCEHVTSPPDEKQPHWRVQLRLQQDATPGNNAPYSFRLAMEGWFILAPNFPADQAERVVSINATGILYGLAREQ